MSQIVRSGTVTPFPDTLSTQNALDNPKRTKTNNVKLGRLCTQVYCGNKYNLLRIFSLFITFLLLCISFLYCVGSVYKLTLSNIWCSNIWWLLV